MLKPRPGILDLPLYKLADTATTAERITMLAANECAVEPSPRALAAYRDYAARLRRYPDASGAPLRAALGARFGIEPTRIVCGNGSEELIYLLARAYAGPGDEVVVRQYGYLLFELAARVAGAIPVVVPARDLALDVDAIVGAVTLRTRIVFIANPNNPTGDFTSAAAIEGLWRRLRDDILLVIDAAYADYVVPAGDDETMQRLGSAPNVVFLRTFSKAYGLASLRIGWAYAPTSVAESLHRIRAPSNVNGPAQAAAVAALGDQAHVTNVRSENARQRARFIADAAKLGFQPVGSETNFTLVRFDDAAKAHAFLKAQGVIARPMDAYGLGAYLRFTIGDAADTDTALAALAALANRPATPRTETS